MVITTTVFWLRSRPKKALWYIALTNKTIIRGNISLQLNIGEKKVGVNETASSETVFKIGHLGNFEGPFDLPNQ